VLNLENAPTIGVETRATPTRAMNGLNLAAVVFGIALAAGWDGLIPPPGQPTSIRVRATTIHVGDSADDIFKILEPADSWKTDAGLDPTHPGSLLVTHHYKIEGQSFSLTFARNHDPGPYRLVRITTSRGMSS
jgi:hypothetical protein